MRWLSILLFSILPLLAISSEHAELHSCSPDGIAVGGYDLVSYHQPGGPLMGSTDIRLEREGLTYRFSSEKNLALFLANPPAYLPLYKGWCATSLALGRLTCPDYTNFKVENGHLLLFETTGFTNGRSLWDSDPLGFKARADEKARKLLN